VSVSDRDSPPVTFRSGTQRARTEHLIRRRGQVVQDRPSMVVGWADIPELSARVECCSAPWLQLRRNDADPRPSAFQAGHILSWCGCCERYALSPVADVSRWLLRLLSPLLSAATGPVVFAYMRHSPTRAVAQCSKRAWQTPGRLVTWSKRKYGPCG
jgi:hypothetical protein